MQAMATNPESYATRRTIAICQTSPTMRGDTEANAKKMVAWMAEAANSGADLALFGELFVSDHDLCNVSGLSEPSDGTVALAVAKAAKELGISVIYGYSEVENGHYYNSLMFINCRGERLANYRKIHLLSNESKQYTRGDALTVVDWDGLRVGLGAGVEACMYEYIGAMVRNGGARLVVLASALPNGPRSEKTPLHLIPTRAIENGGYVAFANLAGKGYLGMSRVCNPFGECLVSENTSKEVSLCATIPLFTDNEPGAESYHFLRRPEIYNSAVAYETELPWRKETRADVQQFFQYRAHYYDKQMEGVYNAPDVAANALDALVKEKTGRILDVAAGTGLVGEALSRKGFANITALDQSESMLKCLREKNVYAGTILGKFEQEARKIASETYCACVCVGAFLTAGFLDPIITVEEMVRLVEVGGFVLLLWNATELNEPQCEEVRDSLHKVIDNTVSRGQCEYVQKTSIPKYLQECVGTLVVLRKL